MIELKKVRKEFNIKKGNNVVAVKDVSLHFGDKGISFILGKSGCGKSTLLNIIGGLDTPTSGEIIIDGKSMKDFKKRDYDNYRNNYVGFIFQEYNLLENHSVYENVALALSLLGDKTDLNKKVAQALKLVNLEGYEQRKVQTLSGGEKQRITIARAMIKNPKILIADEPTGALDEDTGNTIFEILKNISKERLVIVVSHDRDFAEQFGDRIIEMKGGLIVADSSDKIKKTVEETKAITYKSSKMPFGQGIKYGLSGMSKTKGRLIVSILLCSFSFGLLCASISVAFFDARQFIIENIIGSETILDSQMEQIDNFAWSFYYWGLITALTALVFATIMLSNFIVTNVIQRKKEIGILRALGASKADCFKMFLSEIVVIGLFTLILGFIFSYLFFMFMNSKFEEFFAVDWSIFSMNWQGILITIISCFAVSFIALLFPLIRISQLNPIDAIRN